MWEKFARGEKPDHLAAIDKADQNMKITAS